MQAQPRETWKLLFCIQRTPGKESGDQDGWPSQFIILIFRDRQPSARVWCGACQTIFNGTLSELNMWCRLKITTIFVELRTFQKQFLIKDSCYHHLSPFEESCSCTVFGLGSTDKIEQSFSKTCFLKLCIYLILCSSNSWTSPSQ